MSSRLCANLVGMFPSCCDIVSFALPHMLVSELYSFNEIFFRLAKKKRYIDFPEFYKWTIVTYSSTSYQLLFLGKLVVSDLV